MTAGTPTRLDDLTLSEADLVDAACDRFEAEWRQGKAPAIESMLDGASGLARGVLFRELVELEVELRLETGERPARAEYLARFPGDPELVDGIFAPGREPRRLRRTRLAPGLAPPIPFTDGQTVDAGSRVGDSSFDDDPPTADAATRRVLGPYDVLELIGSGGMGLVYRALHRDSGRYVALKLLRPSLWCDTAVAGGREMATRFLIEARTLARLEHENIVTVHDVGSDRGVMFLAMKLIRGRTLSQIVHSEGPLDPRRAAYYVEAAARAIQYAHALDCLHRDVKPANIMVDEHDRPVVVDFGLTKCLGATVSMTRTGHPLGTPDYMSPEQARGDAEISYAADIYGLGATLFVLLTGRPPFAGGDRLAVIRRVIDEEPAWPSDRGRAVGREMKAICLKCLEKDPVQRFRSAGELASALKCYLNYEPTGVTTPGPVSRLVKWARRKPWRTAAVGTASAAALALGMAGAWIDRRERASARSLVSDLITVPIAEVPRKIATIDGHRGWVDPVLRELLRGGTTDSEGRARVALALLPEEPARAGELANRLLECGFEEHRVLREGLQAQWPGVASRARAVLEDRAESPARVARAATALIALDAPSAPAWPAWSILRLAEDPGRRTGLLDWLVQSEVGPEVLAHRLEVEPDPSVRRLLIQALGGLGRGRPPSGTSAGLTAWLTARYADDPDPGVHSSLAYLLRRWDLDGEVRRVDDALAGKPRGDRQWYVNRSGLTMAVLEVPADQRLEPGPPGRLPARFAIATTETTLDLYRKFDPNHPHQRKAGHAPPSNDPEAPADVLSFFDAARFCNWLSEREGIPPDQWCFTPGDGPGVMSPVADYQARRGYRLPTVPEWEFAARAGTGTDRYFGDALFSIDDYAWNTKKNSQPVGRLRPNDFGLFDLFGNVAEWCYHPAPPPPNICACPEAEKGPCLKIRQEAIKGGYFGDRPQSLGIRNRTPYHDACLPHLRFIFAGFRPVKSEP